MITPTVIWSMLPAICITAALPHLLIGLRGGRQRVSLFFALAAFAVAWMAMEELAIMHAVTQVESGRALQYGQLATFVLVAAIVGFVQFYFGTGRRGLALLIIGLRAVGQVINFTQPPNLNYREITGLRSYEFLGEHVTTPVGIPNPWIYLNYVTSLLLLAYVIDASVRLWRQRSPDGRRRAVLVGGAIVFFIVAAQAVAILINTGKIDFPYFNSLAFLAIIAAMGFELTYDVIRAARLAADLQASSAALSQSEERMSMAAESAHLALWEWDVVRDEIWMTDEGRALLGFERNAPLNPSFLAKRVHPDDRAARAAAIQYAMETGGTFEIEYRLVRDDGRLQWIAARGRCAPQEGGNVTRVLGVSLDITQQKQADAEAHRQRNELGHLSRVALVGEMSASLAHELNQPLTAIVTNADAAQRFLGRGEVKIEELREILADISADGHRASEVIRGIKDMVRKAPSEPRAVDLNAVVTDVLRLVRADARAQGCTLKTELAPGLPAVTGDAVQLEQVLLNLIVNALDAMRQASSTPRRVDISTRVASGDTVEIAVRDTGPGLPPEMTARVFERFYSTKSEGMGMGLAIARSIVEAHHGTLEGENVVSEGAPTPVGGARFWFRLPVRVATPVEATA